MIKRTIGILPKVVKLPLKYKRSLQYILRKRGLRSAFRFLLVKYLVGDEGGEMALLNPLVARLPRLAFYPFKIEVEHTTACDKKCIICEHTYWKEKSERLSFEEFKRIIDQFPYLLWINITGEGSGFLNPDFIKMIEYLRARDISVNFVDELDLLDEEKAKKLVEYGVNCIWISMDGATKETYEKIKVGCSFERTIENLKMLLRIKKEYKSPLPTICFRFVVNKLNYQEMPQMVELVSSFKKYGDLGEGSKLEFVGLLKFKEVEHLYFEPPSEIIEETKRKAHELGIEVAFDHMREEELPPPTECSAWFEPYIMMKGYVLPCCAVLMSNKRPFLREHAFGNLLKDSFWKIWNSERYRKFRNLVPKREGPVPILCVGCRAINMNERMAKYGVAKEI
jgi:MoaA/NifB/PqqE/SkfB family radical SAM enzyme